jgi:hypothetical protein
LKLPIDLGPVESYHHGDRLLVAVSDRYMKQNKGKPLIFSAKINQKKELVLTAVLPGLVRAKVSDPREESDGSN